MGATGAAGADAPDAVNSVNGHTGVVVLAASDVGADPVGYADTAIAALTILTQAQVFTRQLGA